MYELTVMTEKPVTTSLTAAMSARENAGPPWRGATAGGTASIKCWACTPPDQRYTPVCGNLAFCCSFLSETRLVWRLLNDGLLYVHCLEFCAGNDAH